MGAPPTRLGSGRVAIDRIPTQRRVQDIVQQFEQSTQEAARLLGSPINVSSKGQPANAIVIPGKAHATAAYRDSTAPDAPSIQHHRKLSSYGEESEQKLERGGSPTHGPSSLSLAATVTSSSSEDDEEADCMTNRASVVPDTARIHPREGSVANDGNSEQPAEDIELVTLRIPQRDASMRCGTLSNDEASPTSGATEVIPSVTEQYGQKLTDDDSLPSCPLRAEAGCSEGKTSPASPISCSHLTGLSHPSPDGLPVTHSPIERSRHSNSNASHRDPLDAAPSVLDRASQSYTAPLPARQVFSSDALPLHLPYLDLYLADQSIFAPPAFSSPESLYSDQEKRLFHIDSAEVCVRAAGRQLRVPHRTTKRSRRRRKRHHAQKLHEPTSPSLAAVSETFPPLMLLNTSTLTELKSNAVGPRSPSRGLLASAPRLQRVLAFFNDHLLSIESSTTVGSLFRFELIRDFAQVMQLNLQSNAQHGTSTKDRVLQNIFFRTLPSIMALDFVSLFGFAVLFLLAWSVLTGLALFCFWRLTRLYDPSRDVQGFEDQPYRFRPATRGTKSALIITTLLLTTLYIPLCKISFDALLWTSDYWAQSGTDQQPASIGMCYTTITRPGGWNYAWFIITIAALTLMVYAIAWPLYLVRLILAMRPNVTRYNELGVKRTAQEMETEYNRQLDRDSSPLNFMYGEYRRKCAFAGPFHLVGFKLPIVLVTSFATRENCLFSNVDAQLMRKVQQGVLVALQALFLVIHHFTRPFSGELSNRSEFFSRCTYVATSALGLLVAFQVPGHQILRDVLLRTLQVFSYTISLYFSAVSTALISHGIKRIQGRLDWSIDIYNPALRLSQHVKRRVWEETLSILLLTADNFRMPEGADVAFTASTQWPPYLLFFRGTVAERHIENLMILKSIGLRKYKETVRFMRSEDGLHHQRVLEQIRLRHTGVDAYFRPTSPPFPDNVESFFGKAFVVPFPPTLVMRYDEQTHGSVTLTDIRDLESFLLQNDAKHIVSRKMLRMSLRALEGQSVYCPYVVPAVRHGAKSAHPVVYREGTLQILRRASALWHRYDFASGFAVSISYSYGQFASKDGVRLIKEPITVSATEAFGFDDVEFSINDTAAQFLRDNEATLRRRVPNIDALLHRHRSHFDEESKFKVQVMDYSFLSDIFDGGLELDEKHMRLAFASVMGCQALQSLPAHFPSTFRSLHERLSNLRRSPVHTFWWLWWDDLYRQNARDYARLRKRDATAGKSDLCFDPKQLNSIAYHPMPRAQLEDFLQERGFWQRDGTRGPITRGTLNRLYFRLNAIVFDRPDPLGPPWTREPGKVIDVGQGSHLSSVSPRHPSTLSDRRTNGDDRHGENTQESKSNDDTFTSSQGNSRLTGGGTDEDRSSIIDRRAWTWEQRLDIHRHAHAPTHNGHVCSSSRLHLWVWRCWDRVMEALYLHPFMKDRRLDDMWVYVQVDECEQRLVIPSSMETGAADTQGTAS